VWNNLSRDNGLVVGQKLFIPSSNTEGYATPTPVGMVLLATPDAAGKIVHEVQPYQALIMIADAYTVKVDTILALNGLLADWPLQIGQKLLIYPGNVTPSPTPRPLSAIEQLTPSSNGNYYHTVKSGEYLAWIADLYEITLAELITWNGLATGSILQPEQQLLLRVTPPATATPIPVQPSITPTSTRTPVPPTSTQALIIPSPSATATADGEVQSSLSRIGAPLVIVLVFAGLLVLGWALRQR
jgi:LysM repeat protein